MKPPSARVRRTRSVLVEPREPYRVKAGIFELCKSFDTNLGLFVVSFDMCNFTSGTHSERTSDWLLDIYMLFETTRPRKVTMTIVPVAGMWNMAERRMNLEGRRTRMKLKNEAASTPCIDWSVRCRYPVGLAPTTRLTCEPTPTFTGCCPLRVRAMNQAVRWIHLLGLLTCYDFSLLS